mgnify:CR=1 FL=1
MLLFALHTRALKLWTNFIAIWLVAQTLRDKKHENYRMLKKTTSRDVVQAELAPAPVMVDILFLYNESLEPNLKNTTSKNHA